MPVMLVVFHIYHVYMLTPTIKSFWHINSLMTLNSNGKINFSYNIYFFILKIFLLLIWNKNWLHIKKENKALYQNVHIVFIVGIPTSGFCKNGHICLCIECLKMAVHVGQLTQLETDYIHVHVFRKKVKLSCFSKLNNI